MTMKASLLPLRSVAPVHPVDGFAVAIKSSCWELDMAVSTTSLQPSVALAREARALLTRLARVKTVSGTLPMVPDAAPGRRALRAIDRHLTARKRYIRQAVDKYLDWLKTAAQADVTPEQMNRQFTIVRLKFNAVLDQLDIFSDVITQRSEHDYGIWLAGLDQAARDALHTPTVQYDAPPLMCYLDRGHGAAIRRARTRLPGGHKNPVAIIRVPRERMIGGSIAASLFHEVGHQGNALLDLVDSIGNALERNPGPQPAWDRWIRWRSEILSDLWGLAQLGVGATQGLISVVSLPTAFVFRLNQDDPHPSPWIRVLLSTYLGDALFPDPQWQVLRKRWKSYYPLGGQSEPVQQFMQQMEGSLPQFVERVLNHRSDAWGNRRLADIFPIKQRQPNQLRALGDQLINHQLALTRLNPGHAFAVLGQLRHDGRLTPENEANHIEQLLAHWAHQQANGESYDRR
jgi:hypothetical protein